MRRFYSLLLLFSFFVIAIAGPDKKKPKLIDHYYVDSEGYLTEFDGAYSEIKVYEDADSIVVHQFLAQTGVLLFVNTYKVLNDSINERWGTQLAYYPNGNVKRYEFLDTTLGEDRVMTYSEEGMKEQETYVNLVTGVSTSTTWFPSGKKKSYTKSVRDINNNESVDFFSWFENGQLKREQKSVAQKTVSLNMFDEGGAKILTIPVQQGDTVYVNKEGGVVSRDKAVKYGVVSMDGDSIKFKNYNLKNKLISEENYMTYSLEDAVTWGVQRYYYENAAQMTDSVFVFRGVNGEDLLLRKYYPDGKIMSESSVSYNNVLLPVKVLKQYYPSGVLRRYQKHVGEKLVEGHVYNSEGKETEPFYEFKEE